MVLRVGLSVCIQVGKKLNIVRLTFTQIRVPESKKISLIVFYWHSQIVP